MTARRRRSPAVTPSTPRAASSLWPRALLLVACLLTYANSLSIPFVLDDVATVASNAQSLVPSRNASAVGGRPVVQLSLALNYLVGTFDVRVYHAWNLAIHVACVLLLFGLVRRTLQLPSIDARLRERSTGLACAAALVWAVHPLNSEVIDYVVQRTESTMALFYLATLYASLRAMDAPHPRRWQTLAVAACALGMGAKESMATAPLMVALFDRVFVFGSFRRALGVRRGLYAALAATWLVLAAIVSSAARSESAGFSTGISSWTYLLNQTVMITRYVGLSFWPRSLVAFYGWPRPLTLGDVIPQTAFVLVLLVMAGVALYVRPKIGFLGAWFFVTLAPASSIVPVATEVGAERRMYLPLAALLLLLVIAGAVVWDVLFRRRDHEGGGGAAQRWGAGIVVGVVSVALGLQTVARNREYASALSLARTDVARWPTSIAHHVLGEQLLAVGENDEAVRELAAAVPGDSMARLPLGIELFNQDRLNESIAQLDAFVRTWRLPYRLVPHWLEPSATEVIDARTTMARAFTKLQQWPKVVEQCELILAMSPSHADALALMADALYAQERFDQAAPYYRRYAALRPTDASPFTRLGVILMATGKPDEGLAMFQRAAELAPRDWQAQRNLAMALFDAHNADETVVHAREAITLKPADAAAHALLGRALAVQGKMQEAVAEIERAIELDPNDSQAREDLRRLSRVRNR